MSNERVQEQPRIAESFPWISEVSPRGEVQVQTKIESLGARSTGER